MNLARLAAFAVASVCAGVLACSGSSNDGGDKPVPDAGGSAGDGASPDGGGTVGMHPSCTGTRTFPTDLGASCGAGSNLALCAVSSKTCSSTACLWDGTTMTGSSRGSAYCTVSCEPSDPESCPSGYACKPQGCGDGPANVCVKLPNATQPTTCDDYPKTSSGKSTNWQVVATSSDGYEYLFGPNPDALGITAQSRKPGGAWTSAGDFSTDTQLGITRSGQVDVGGATALATSIGVLRLEGGKAARELTPAAREKLLTVFVANGAARALVVTANATEVRDRDARGTFATTSSIPRKDCFIARPLSKSGVVAVCGTSDANALYAGTSATDFAQVAMPDGEKFGGYTETLGVLAGGKSPDDMWILTRTSRVFHRVGMAWYQEGVPQGRVLEETGSFGSAGFFAGADGTQYVVQEMSMGQSTSYKPATFALRDGCWALDALAGTEPYVPLATGGFVYGTDRQLCATK